MAEDPLEQYRHGYENAARFYNLFADNIDLPFYLEYAKKQGSPILELAAGTGRVSLVLAREGFEVHSLEASPDMLQEFRRRLSLETSDVVERIHILESDMTDFNLRQRYPLIVIPTSFGHALTTDEQLSLLHCVHEHLQDDGVFIVDLFPGGIQPRSASFSENPVPIEDGKTVTRSGVISTDPISQIMALDLTFTIRDGSGNILEQIIQKSGAAIIYNREMDLLLRMSELKIVEEFGTFNMHPYSVESGRRILVVTKK